MTALQKMERARTQLVLNAPFFGALALRLTLHEDNSIPTACTNGRYIRFNASFVDSLKELETLTLFAHEVCHCAAGHFWRRSSRDATAWNVATDYEINNELVRNGFTMPAGALVDSQFDGMAAETIFDRLPKQSGNGQQQQQQQTGNGSAGPGQSSGSAGQQQQQQTSSAGQTGQQQTGSAAGPADPSGLGAVEDAPADDIDDAGNNLKDQWQIATVQAAKAAKSFGKLPAFGERLLDELTRPALPWSTLLADFVQRTARNDYEWTRVNRTHAQRGIFLPTIHNNELPAVVVAIDTSGSIDAETLAAFAGAVSDILTAYATTAHVVFCDASIQHAVEYSSADLPIRIDNAPGGGGTDFRPVFDWIDEHDIEPAALVYLTDGYGTYPDDEPSYPVLWTMTTDYDAPFGETIRISDHA